jgi:hypothetical protein
MTEFAKNFKEGCPCTLLFLLSMAWVGPSTRNLRHPPNSSVHINFLGQERAMMGSDSSCEALGDGVCIMMNPVVWLAVHSWKARPFSCHRMSVPVVIIRTPHGIPTSRKMMHKLYSKSNKCYGAHCFDIYDGQGSVLRIGRPTPPIFCNSTARPCQPPMPQHVPKDF